jgi:pimeloyl-ACP methyl ester carboxylesterase
VQVKTANRLDWTFVEGKKSLDKPPNLWTAYDAAKQRYELYAPPDRDPAKAYPVVLFLSPDPKPAGWSTWQKLCQEQQVIFAGPYDAGDNKPLWERTRIALDVLDDVRRTHKIDPDRTYICGLGGGARLAGHIAFALPELFGGVVCFSGGDLLRDEAWLRLRVSERLSVAWTFRQDLDPSKTEIESLYAPFFDKLKIRSRAWPGAGQGRGAPSSAQIDEIYRWLEEGVEQRRQLAEKYPASRIEGDAAPTRQEWANKVFQEAKARVEHPEKTEQFLAGMVQLHGAAQRWDDLPVLGEIQRLYVKLSQSEGAMEALSKQRHVQDMALARDLTVFLKGPTDQGELARNAAAWERHQQWMKLAADMWKKIKQSPERTPEEEAEADTGMSDIEKIRLGPAGK